MKKRFGIMELEPRIMLDAAAVAAISNDVFHFDAQDIDADGDTADQPADEAAIDRWDEFENNHDATSSGGNRPVYDADAFDGRGGIRFDGSNDSFGVGNSGDINTSSYSEKSYAFVFETGSDLSGHQVLYEQGGGTRGYQLSIANGDLYAYVWNNAEWNAGDHNKSINLGTLSTSTSYQAIMIQDSTGPNTWSANLNGGAFTTLNNVDTQRPHSGNIEIGSSGNSLHPVTFSGISGDPFQGSIGEIYSWNHALTSQEATDVADFYNSKWFNEAPTISTNMTLDVVTDESLSITNSNLETTDPDNTPDELIYTLQSEVANGDIFLSGTALITGDTFTQQDINNGLLTYDHNGNATTSDSFDFTLTDGFDSLSSQTFNINISSGTTSDPTIINNTGFSVDEGNSHVLTTGELDSADSDTPDTNLVYQITTNSVHGTISLDGTALSLNDTFTHQNINDGRVNYLHNDSENFLDGFDFTLTDGTTTTDIRTFGISVNPVSDQDPSDIALTSTNINENTGNGTLIGTLSGTDGDLPSEPLTFSIISDPDNKFQISGDRLEVDGNLNHEAAASHNVTIRVSDGNGGTRDEVFTIFINDVNENPTSLTLSNNTVNENAALGTLIGTFSATDPDEPGDSFSFSIINDPDNKFRINGNTLEVDGTLDFEPSNSHNVTVRVSDGNGGTQDQGFTINVNDINDIPIATTGETNTGQGQALTLAPSMLSASDQDNVDTSLVFTVTDTTTSGILELSGVTLNNGDTFTQQDVIDGAVTYAHNNTATVSSDSFDFTVTDGALTTAPTTLVIDLSPSKTTLNDVTLDEGDGVTINNGTIAFEGEWFNDNWQYREQITIDHTQIDTDLTDFSVLLTQAGFDSDFWSHVNADGSDIVITAADGTTQLDRELVSIDTSGQTMQLYARTDLSASVDTNLFIYYGNAGASETNQVTTWRSEFTGVWHFDSDFDAADPQVNDSSQAGSEGSARNGFDSGNQTGGVIGQAAEFNKSEYIALNKSFSGNNSLDAISVSTWVNTTFSSAGFNDNWAIIDFDRSEFFNVFVQGNGEVGFSTNANGIDDFSSAGVTVNDGNWHHISTVYNGTDKIIYVDGAEVARDTNSHGGQAMGSGTRFGFIGDGSEAGGFDGNRNGIFFDGQIDNLRMFEGTTSGEWIAAEYSNQNNPGGFYRTGDQTQLGEQVQYNLTNASDNGTLFVDANGNGALDGGEEISLSDTFTQADIDNGDLIYLHDGSETLSDNFSFDVTDITTGSASVVQTLNFTINPINDIVSFNEGSTTSLNINEDSGEVNINSLLNASDGDIGDTLTWSIVSGPSNGTLGGFNAIATSTGGSVTPSGLTYAPDFNFNGSDNFTIRVSDGSFTDDITINMTIDPVNNAPVINAIPDQTIDQNNILNGISITVSDVDSALSALTINGSSDNQLLIPNGNISISGTSSTRTLFIPHNQNEFGQATITLDISDGLDSSSQSFNLNVNQAGGFFVPPPNIGGGQIDSPSSDPSLQNLSDSDFTGTNREEYLFGENIQLNEGGQNFLEQFYTDLYGSNALEQIHQDMVVQYVSRLNNLSDQRLAEALLLETPRQEGQELIAPDKAGSGEPDAISNEEEPAQEQIFSGQAQRGISEIGEYYERLNAALFEADTESAPDKDSGSIIDQDANTRATLQNQFDSILAYQKNYYDTLSNALSDKN